jgi:hypothetical protein
LPKDLPPKSTVHDYLELWNWGAATNARVDQSQAFVWLATSNATQFSLVEAMLTIFARAYCAFANLDAGTGPQHCDKIGRSMEAKFDCM